MTHCQEPAADPDTHTLPYHNRSLCLDIKVTVDERSAPDRQAVSKDLEPFSKNGLTERDAAPSQHEET